MTETASRTFDLPPSARDWLTAGERAWYRLPQHVHGAAELAAHEQLVAWDALAGKLMRESIFGDGGRRARVDAHAVAAVAEQLAVALGVER